LVSRHRSIVAGIGDRFLLMITDDQQVNFDRTERYAE